MVFFFVDFRVLRLRGFELLARPADFTAIALVFSAADCFETCFLVAIDFAAELRVFFFGRWALAISSIVRPVLALRESFSRTLPACLPMSPRVAFFDQ